MSQSKEAKQKQVLRLTEERNKRTPKEQLWLLNRRLGDGVGAVKERARLATLIAKGQEKVQTITHPENLITIPDPVNVPKVKKPRAKKEKVNA